MRLCIQHPPKAPVGQNPKHPQGNTEHHVCHPSHIATRPATMQGGADTKICVRSKMSNNPTPGGHPINATKRHASPALSGVYHTAQYQLLLSRHSTPRPRVALKIWPVASVVHCVRVSLIGTTMAPSWAHVEGWVACRTFYCSGIGHPSMVE